MQFHIPYALYSERYPTKLLALYHALRDAMLDGRLDSGSRLPSTRELASLYNLSRGTVNQVYEMLSAEGYLRSRTGQGTFVAFQREGLPPRGEPEQPSPAYRLSAWGQRLEETPLHIDEVTPSVADFHRFGQDLSVFPRDTWTRLLHAQVRQLSHADDLPRACPPEGELQLREAIALYLRRARGIAASPEQIAVTGGSMQALALLAHLLLAPGDAAVAESPSYSGIRRAIRSVGARCVDAPIDAQGIVPADWDAQVLFVTPARQFPTGAVLSLERRQALLRWASAREAVIIEDDYDSEFRHRGKALEPLKALDREARVVYVGSFTKTMLPNTRIGYAVLPPALAKPFARAQALFEPYPPHVLEQLALASFMASGEYDRHLRRMKRVYSRKWAFLRQAAARLEPWIEWLESDAGLHVFGWWRHTPEAYERFRGRCFTAGVRWSEVTEAVSAVGSGPCKYGLYLQFAHLTEEQMMRGMERMRMEAEHGNNDPL